LFLKYIMESSLMKNQIKGNSSGTTVSTLTILRMSNYIIPLPPLGEQNRIVKKIEKLLLLSERYEVAWNKLESLNRKFPEDLQKSFLQEALQGKVCEQKDKEEIGKKLIERMLKEKAYLIKTGQMKKQKVLPPIQEFEIPFDIPKSWGWERLGNISTYNQTKKKVRAVDLDDLTWVLDLEDIEKDTGDIINYLMAKDKNVTGEKVVFYKGQLLYSKLRPYLKKILIAPSDGVCTPELVPFDIFGGCNRNYILYVLKSPYIDSLINSVTYGVKMPRVGTDTMLNLLIPVPSIKEQNNIVDMIDQVNSLCDKLRILIK
ncbi:MAG: restriction endonuclease subunit S, partial [Clostridioides difficile]